MNKYQNNNRHFFDKMWRFLFRLTGGVSVVLLVGIFIFLAVNASRILGSISLGEFLFGAVWNPTSYHAPLWGTLSLVYGTFIISALALIIALPLGLGTAVYLSEIAPRAVKEFLKPMVEMIASIPSVVLGLIGLLFLAPVIARLFGLSNGLNALTAAILVAFTALPTIASISEDALASVSPRLREASYALGASQWETIWRVSVPAALSGIVASVMLGFGRIIGETMIVLMVAGNSLAWPRSPLSPVRPMTATIAIEIKEVVVNSLHWHALFAVGLLLFLITFLLNIFVDVWLKKKLI